MATQGNRYERRRHAKHVISLCQHWNIRSARTPVYNPQRNSYFIDDGYFEDGSKDGSFCSQVAISSDGALLTIVATGETRTAAPIEAIVNHGR